MSAAPVRLVLFGVLSAALFALLLAAANVVRVRPARVAPSADEAVETPRPQAQPRPRPRAPLPSVLPAACTPRSGWACWRGSLRLPPAVQHGWRTAVMEARSASRDLPELADWSDDDVRLVTASEQSGAAAPEGPLPPEASFALFFEIELIRSADDDDEPRPDGTVTVFSDGTFEAHVPAGRYDLEVTSHDGFVVGGLESLPARAGAIETGIEIPLVAAVAVEGRVVDEDGIPVPQAVSIARKGQEVTTTSFGSDGGFSFEGLRPGAYVLSAGSDGDERVEREVTAPARAIELRVPRAVDGLLLLPRSHDGSCPAAKLKLASLDGQVRSARRLVFGGCRAIIGNLSPDQTWRVSGEIDGRPFQRDVRFDRNRPPTPICLDFPCDPFVAMVDVWIFDADGDRVSGDLRIESTPYGGPAVGEIVGDRIEDLPGAGTLTLSATVDDRRATTTVSLRPGINRAVIRLPASP